MCQPPDMEKAAEYLGTFCNFRGVDIVICWSKNKWASNDMLSTNTVVFHLKLCGLTSISSGSILCELKGHL